MTELKLLFRRRRRDTGKGPVAEMAEQIRSVDDAAQRAGRRLRQSAGRLRASGRSRPAADGELLAELAETLVARADGVRAECAELSAVLDRATRLIAEDGRGSQERANGFGGEPASREDLRMTATRMAIAGRTRREIQAELRGRLDDDDLEPVLDEVFGESHAVAS